MVLVSWMYISRSLLPPARADEELQRIVTDAHRRNQENLVTGALLFTGTRFAQYLEGPGERVTGMQGRINADPRHTDIVTIEQQRRAKRSFETWGLTFVGSSSHYVASAVARPLLVDPQGRREGIDSLRHMMMEFARPGVTAVPRRS